MRNLNAKKTIKGYRFLMHKPNICSYIYYINNSQFTRTGEQKSQTFWDVVFPDLCCYRNRMFPGYSISGNVGNSRLPIPSQKFSLRARASWFSPRHHPRKKKSSNNIRAHRWLLLLVSFASRLVFVVYVRVSVTCAATNGTKPERYTPEMGTIQPFGSY